MTRFDDLPAELLDTVFQQLSLADVVGLSEVNMKLRATCSDRFICKTAIEVSSLSQPAGQVTS